MALADVLAPLQQPLFILLDTPVSWVEVLGFGGGALCVWLVARWHIANWPVGIANNLFFILLFGGAGFYAALRYFVTKTKWTCRLWTT